MWDCAGGVRFLHETVLSVTTTRTLLEGRCGKWDFMMRMRGWRSVKDFPRVRGDKLMVLGGICAGWEEGDVFAG